MFRFISPFWKNRQGSTAMEMALVVVPLFFMMFAAIEFGARMYWQSVVETAAAAGARLTAAEAQNMSREQLIRNEITRLSDGHLNGGAATINRVVFTSPDPARAEPCLDRPDPPCTGAFADLNGNGVWDDAATAGSSAIIVLQITYPWAMSTPLIGNLFAGGADLRATAAVSNGW